jgi:hypothetical protein
MPAAARLSIASSVRSRRSSGSPPVTTASSAPTAIDSSTIALHSASDSSGVRATVWRGESV